MQANRAFDDEPLSMRPAVYAGGPRGHQVQVARVRGAGQGTPRNWRNLPIQKKRHAISTQSQCDGLRGELRNSEVTLHNSEAAAGRAERLGAAGGYLPNHISDKRTTQREAPASGKVVRLSSSSTPTSGGNIYLGVGSVQAGTGIATAGDRIVLLNSKGEVASTYTAPRATLSRP